MKKYKMVQRTITDTQYNEAKRSLVLLEDMSAITIYRYLAARRRLVFVYERGWYKSMRCESDASQHIAEILRRKQDDKTA